MEAHSTAKRPDIDSKPMIELYNQGLSATQIANRLGLCKSSVSRRLKKLGIKLRKSSEYTGQNRYWRWNGKHTDLERKRYSRFHQLWSRAVRERDGYECQDCHAKNIRLHVHHLVSLKECLYSSLAFDISNGITLCVKCHWKRHTDKREIDHKSIRLLKPII